MQSHINQTGKNGLDERLNKELLVQTYSFLKTRQYSIKFLKLNESVNHQTSVHSLNDWLNIYNCRLHTLICVLPRQTQDQSHQNFYCSLQTRNLNVASADARSVPLDSYCSLQTRNLRVASADARSEPLESLLQFADSKSKRHDQESINTHPERPASAFVPQQSALC